MSTTVLLLSLRGTPSKSERVAVVARRHRTRVQFGHWRSSGASRLPRLKAEPHWIAFIHAEKTQTEKHETLPLQPMFIPQSRQSDEKAPTRRFSPNAINLSSRLHGRRICRFSFVLRDSGCEEWNGMRGRGKDRAVGLRKD